MKPTAEERADELIEGRWNHNPADENGEAVEVLTTAIVRFIDAAYRDGRRDGRREAFEEAARMLEQWDKPWMASEVRARMEGEK